MKKLFKEKPMLLLISILLMIALTTCVYILIAGDTYHLTYELPNVDTKQTSISYEIKNGNIKVDELYCSDHTLHMTVSSAKPGKDAVTVKIHGNTGDDTFVYCIFTVTKLGIVVYRNILDLNGSKLIEISMLIGMLLICVAMLSSYNRHRRQAHYSYNMIVRGGLGQFFGMQAVVLIMYLHGSHTLADLFLCISSTGTLLSLLMVPLMLILAASVSISNLSLIRHEGFHVLNMLGIISSLLWMIGTILTVKFGLNASGSAHEVAFITSVNTVISFIVLYFECMLFATILSSILASKHKPPFDRDYIIILGCAILPDGRLTPILKARADAALAFEREQFEAVGRHAVFVPSGGQGDDEIISESEAISRYLQKKGTPPERILIENNSVNTFENMKFSKQKIEEHCKSESYNAAFATTNYHVFRGYTLARKNKLTAQGIASKTKWYFFPNAFLREFVGLIAEELPHHIVMLVIMLVSAVVMNVLAFF